MCGEGPVLVPEIVNAELIRFLGSDSHGPAGRGGR